MFSISGKGGGWRGRGGKGGGMLGGTVGDVTGWEASVLGLSCG
jgi:hypothetical protein